MRAPYQILFPLLGLFFCRVDLTDLYPLELPVKLLKIYDGDSLLVGKGSYQFKLRISKIDSPEKNQKFILNHLSAGEESVRCLEKILKKETQLTLRVFQYDMYGRVLGDVNHLSYKLISQGCASLYPYAYFNSREEKLTYLQALKMAKARRAGIWQFGGYIQPKNWRKSNKQIARRQ
jgi:micrococcal nuclease